MSSLVKSSLVEARKVRRAYHVTVVVGEDYPPLRWRPSCVGCGIATSRCEKRQSGEISRREWKNVATTRHTTRSVVLAIPLCQACSNKERREHVLWFGVVATLAALVVLAMLAALWPAPSQGQPNGGDWVGFGFGAVVIGLLVFGVGSKFRPSAWVGVTPTWGAQAVIVFRRRGAARELIDENASNQGEASELMEQLQGGP